METQFGLAHVWSQGDWVTRAVAVILLGMSLASWLVILIKLLDLRTHRAQAQAAETFWHATDFEDGLGQLGADTNNPFRQLAETGREATRHIQRQDDPLACPGNTTPRPQLHDQLDVSDWVTRELRNSIDEFTARLQSGLAVLASVGSTAPFVGLFGTVWGIYHALLGIGAAGQATIDKVAGPIGEALIMTALGLAVAIPAVLGYNALVRGNKGVLHKLNRFGHDLHALFVTGARVRQGGHAGAPAPSPAPAVVALRKP
jgi:biopolymer transport protein ExbB